MTKMELMNAIERVLHAKGVSRAKLASDIGVSTKTVWCWFNQGKITIDHLFKLLEMVDLELTCFNPAYASMTSNCQLDIYCKQAVELEALKHKMKVINELSKIDEES